VTSETAHTKWPPYDPEPNTPMKIFCVRHWIYQCYAFRFDSHLADFRFVFFLCFFSGSSVEFAFHPQHETSCDSEIQMKEDFNYFKNKSRKRTRSWWMFSVNSNDWEEHWNTKSHQKMDWIQKNEAGTKRRLKTFRLQGHLNVYLFKPLCIYTPHVIASHN